MLSLFMADPLAVGPNPNLRTLAAIFHLGLVCHNLAVFSQGFNLHEGAFPSLLTETVKHIYGQGIRSNLFLHLENVPLWIDGHIFRMIANQ